MNLIKKIIIYSRDALALIVLLLFYHLYELMCYVLGNMFHYYTAVAIGTGVLFLVSTAFIYLHDFFQDHFSWDALKLQYINNLAKNDHIPPHQIFRRATRRVLLEGFWVIFLIGPIILGPFVIAILLRKQKTLQVNLLYTFTGALINSLFWVALMRGVGVLTWGYIEELRKLM
jgi:hypothetical protein